MAAHLQLTQYRYTLFRMDVCPHFQAPPYPGPVAHLAQVVKVVLVPDPSVTGLSTVRFVGDVPGVFTLTYEELSFEELDTHMWEGES